MGPTIQQELDLLKPSENTTDLPNSDLFEKCLLSSKDVRDILRDYDRDVEKQLLRYKKTIPGVILEASSKRIE